MVSIYSLRQLRREVGILTEMKWRIDRERRRCSKEEDWKKRKPKIYEQWPQGVTAKYLVKLNHPFTLTLAHRSLEVEVEVEAEALPRQCKAMQCRIDWSACRV